MTEDEITRLAQLRPTITNVIGFYDLLYEQGDLPPAKRMIYEAHFATAAHHMAAEVLAIIRAVIDRADD